MTRVHKYAPEITGGDLIAGVDDRNRGLSHSDKDILHLFNIATELLVAIKFYSDNMSPTVVSHV
ncbi:hypothetical protein DSUL_50195 [Desulfovibrionales bacterium]